MIQHEIEISDNESSSDERLTADETSISEDRNNDDDDDDVNVEFSDLDELHHISRVCLWHVKQTLIDEREQVKG